MGKFMDDCADLEQILIAHQKALTLLELQAASYTTTTIPVPLKLQLDEKREEVAKWKKKLEETQLAQEKAQSAAQVSINRESPMRSPVSDEYYIERDEAKGLLERFTVALKQPERHPLLFNIFGIGGVGKTTLLRRLQEDHAGEVDFLKVCFAKTPGIETPLELMRKLHQQARQLLGVETSADSFTQREQQFETALFELSQRSLDGEANNSEEAKKIRSWFKRLIWLSSTGLTSTSSKPKYFEPSRSGFSGLATINEDVEGLQEWIQQRVRNHPATKDQPELQALMLEPVSKLTQAFAGSLMQIAQNTGRSLVLVLDTYEKAQSYLNQWLWQYLVEDTPLNFAPVRLVVVGRRSLQADEGWRKFNQDWKLLYDVQLKKFDKKYTDDYLQQIGIQNGGTRAKIYKATQGLPYYLDWVRRQQEQGKELDFSTGHQAIADLLLQGLDSQQRKVLQVVACCRWFNLAMIRYLLGSDSLGLQADADNVESYFEWLKRSDFVESTKGRYRLDDVVRDVFRQSYFQDDQNQFRKTNALLAKYFKQQADDVVAPQSLLPDPYEDGDWRELNAEFLYYSFFSQGGLQQYIEQVFTAIYLREPEVFITPFAFISAEMNEENQHLLPKATGKFFNESEIVFRFGWRFLDKAPRSYQLKFEDEDNLSDNEIETFLKKVEGSLQVLLKNVANLPEGFGKCVGLMYKSLRCNRCQERTDSLLQAKNQTEQLFTHCNPKLLHSLFLHLGQLLMDTERYEDSLCCYQKALELKQNDALVFFSQGIALGNLNRHQEALESLQEAINLDSRFVNAWIALATSFVNLEQYDKALEKLQEAINLDPNSIDALVKSGALLNEVGQYYEALEKLQKAINLDPNSVNARIIKGHVLRNLKQYKESFDICNQAFKIEPKTPSIPNSQALTLSFLKDFEKAIIAIDEAINLEPQEAIYKANRGIILARAGRYIEALGECEQAIKQAPKDESGYYAKACYYALQGEVEQAVDNLQKAIDIAPSRSRSEAKHNPDFDAIRDDERFQALVYLEPKF
jgi:tetratricopeptide (TPR) repeat protein